VTAVNVAEKTKW